MASILVNGIWNVLHFANIVFAFYCKLSPIFENKNMLNSLSFQHHRHGDRSMRQISSGL